MVVAIRLDDVGPGPWWWSVQTNITDLAPR